MDRILRVCGKFKLAKICRMHITCKNIYNIQGIIPARIFNKRNESLIESCSFSCVHKIMNLHKNKKSMWYKEMPNFLMSF